MLTRNPCAFDLFIFKFCRDAFLLFLVSDYGVVTRPFNQNLVYTIVHIMRVDHVVFNYKAINVDWLTDFLIKVRRIGSCCEFT